MKKLIIVLFGLALLSPCYGTDAAPAATTATPAATTTAAPTTTTATPTTTTAAPTGGNQNYDYKTIPLADYDKYPLIPSLRDMGIKLVLAEALKNGHITDSGLVLQTTNMVEYRKAATNNNEFYRFNVSLANGNNKSQSVMGFYVARHDTVALVDAIPYWFYKAKMNWVTNPTTSVVETEPTPQPEPQPEPEPVPEPEPEPEPEPTPAPVVANASDTILYPWILQPAADYTNEFHTDNANYGMNYWLGQEIPKGNVTNGTYTVKSIEEIYKQTLPNVTNWRYHIKVDKAEDDYIYNITFGLNYPTATGKRQMGFYRFQTLDASGKNVGKGALPGLAPLQNATQTVTTTTVDGKPVSTVTGGIETTAPTAGDAAAAAPTTDANGAITTAAP